MVRFPSRLALLGFVTTFAALWALGTAQSWAMAGSSDLTLAITDPVAGARVINGDVRRVGIALTNTAAVDAGPVGIEIEIIGGSFEAPATDGVRWRERRGRWIGRISSLAAGQTLEIPLDINFVPLRTGDETRTAGGGLVVSARVRGDRESIGPLLSDDWIMANCGAVFHASLQQISGADAVALREAIQSAKEGWRSLRGRWVFDPGRVRGDDLFRSVVTAANRLVRARGVDARLKQALKERTLSRLVTDLRAYLDQRQTPAICTGAPQYMDFLATAMEDLRDRADTVTDAFDAAGQQADWKLLAAEAVLADAPAPLDDAAEQEETQQRLDALRALAGEARGLWARVIDGDTQTGYLLEAVETLEGYSDRLDALSIGRRSALAEQRDAMNTALSAIEALAYLQNAHAHHRTVEGLFDGTMGSVRSAHATSCTCGR